MVHLGHLRAGSAAIALLATVHALPARGYVRAVAESGAPLWWRTTCIGMELDLTSPPPSLTADQYLAAGIEAARAWSRPAVACTGIQLTMSRQGADASDTGLDGRNVIVFRADLWCEHPVPDDPSLRYCYPANALAVTTVTKNKTTGEIVDADMELNAVRYAWADLAAHPELASPRTADFQNTVTHELGHVLGLAHPCWIANDGPAPLLDNDGQPEPSCNDPNLPATIADSTMFSSVSTSDTVRRTLAPDDQRAVCEIYPAAEASCPSADSGGCTLAAAPVHLSGAGRTRVLAGIALALGLGLGWGWRASQRRRR
jgi:hypothetical protein